MKHPDLLVTLRHLEESSSSKKDGVSWEEESRARLRYCKLIQRTGQQLRMSQKAIVSAMEYCHRYYASSRSMLRSSTFVMAGAALFLAGKAVETPKRLKDLLQALVSVAYGTKPLVEAYMLEQGCQEELRESVLRGERSLLYALGLNLGEDLCLEHVLHFFLQPEGRAMSDLSPRRSDKPVLLQIAYDIASDSARTTLCLQFEPWAVALASIWLAAKTLKIPEAPGASGRLWWEDRGLSVEQLKGVTEQLVQLYSEESAEDMELAEEDLMAAAVEAVSRAAQ